MKKEGQNIKKRIKITLIIAAALLSMTIGAVVGIKIHNDNIIEQLFQYALEHQPSLDRDREDGVRATWVDSAGAIHYILYDGNISVTYNTLKDEVIWSSDFHKYQFVSGKLARVWVPSRKTVHMSFTHAA